MYERDVAISPGYYNMDKDKNNEAIHYFKLDQHTKAKKVCDGFDPSIKYSDCTIADKEYFSDFFPNIKYHIFFDQAPIYYNYYYTQITHNIRSYVLYILSLNKTFTITAFDSSAALSPMNINTHEEVFTPSAGIFVVTLTHEKREIDIIIDIDIDKHSSCVEWHLYAKTSEDYSIFDSVFREGMENHNLYEGKVFDRKGKFIELVDVGFDDIVLNPELREEVRTNIIDYVDKDKIAIKRKNSLPTKRGVIFSGDPGTGKTFLSRVLANHLKTTFMVITELEGPSEITSIFDFAKQFKNIILLFEDIDIYIKNRDFGDTLLPSLLNQLDGVGMLNNIVILCTTNDVGAMDKALNNRPGRFDRILTFDTPSEELKIEMLKGFCKGKNADGINFKQVVQYIPKKFTGAHLKEIYITACNDAIDAKELDKNDIVLLSTIRFREAIESIKLRKEPLRVGFASNPNTSI